jgi:acetyl-CoA C-acetyltransferase
MSEQKIYIIGAKRSPIGSFLGSLKDVHPAELGAQVLKQLLEDTKVDVDVIDEVIVGNVIPAGAKQGLARQISIKAGIPDSVPAYVVNMVCGSGMKAIINAYASMKAGMASLIVAGGVESMSQTPFYVSHAIRSGNKMGNLELSDGILHDGLMDAFGNMHMGITAENIVDRQNISREEQDAFALRSQEKAIQAVDQGIFDAEIVPIEIVGRKETIIFSKDEYPNRSTNAEKIAKLRPAFKKDGSVTAANSSGINDGASFTIIANEEAVKKYNLTPLAEIVAVGQGALDPNVMGMGPVPAIRNTLKRTSLKLQDMDVFELNEAFAAQSIGVVNELAEEHGMKKEDILEKTNVHGGAIALGHPIGMSGNRIVVSLLHEMKRSQLNYGLASLCIGGGMGTALILKNV